MKVILRCHLISSCITECWPFTSVALLSEDEYDALQVELSSDPHVSSASAVTDTLRLRLQSLMLENEALRDYRQAPMLDGVIRANDAGEFDMDWADQGTRIEGSRIVGVPSEGDAFSDCIERTRSGPRRHSMMAAQSPLARDRRKIVRFAGKHPGLVEPDFGLMQMSRRLCLINHAEGGEAGFAVFLQGCRVRMLATETTHAAQQPLPSDHKSSTDGLLQPPPTPTVK